LEIALQQLLARADVFVLLASQAAARSIWVSYEVEQWLKDRDVREFLIVLTDGKIRWDNNSCDFDWQETTALPTCLKGRFSSEPLYLDLSSEQHGGRLLDQPEVLSVIVTLASAFDGREKAELIDASILLSQRSQEAALGCSLIATLYAVMSGILSFVGHGRVPILAAACAIFSTIMAIAGYFLLRRIRTRTNLYKRLKTATQSNVPLK
jgi:hypothetical protein